ncbi:MAG TPA: phage protein Gp36 family protein, partial [Puia sp.]|nr:phage protein Gp36 family protein [Puia sp.]
TNIFPDDVNQGAQYWGAGSTYAVPANTDILDITYWQMGDNRCQQLKTYLVDIALYHMHSAIAPKNVPELREKRYDDAVKWLKAAGRGDVTASLPLLQPRQGSRNRYGGQIKNNNSW